METKKTLEHNSGGSNRKSYLFAFLGLVVGLCLSLVIPNQLVKCPDHRELISQAITSTVRDICPSIAIKHNPQSSSQTELIESESSSSSDSSTASSSTALNSIVNSVAATIVPKVAAPAAGSSFYDVVKVRIPVAQDPTLTYVGQIYYDVVKDYVRQGSTVKHVKWPAIIEPLTESLRPAQWELTQQENLLETRGAVMFLPNSLPPGTRYNRVIYLDVGARSFRSSLHWFLSHYPLIFDEIHTFEVNGDVFEIPPVGELVAQFGDRARAFVVQDGANQNGGSGSSKYKYEHHHALVSVTDRPRPSAEELQQEVSEQESLELYGPKAMLPRFTSKRFDCQVLDLARFIKEQVKPSLDDFLVMKIDIEGSEYLVMDHLRKQGVLPYIDELFMEMHFSHPSMYKYGWGTFQATRDEARQLLQDLRREGVYAHSWP